MESSIMESSIMESSIMESSIMESSIMESGIHWLDLPFEIWEMIFSNLDNMTLLKTSATCKKFNDWLSLSQHLMKKFRLRIGKRILYHSGFKNELDKENAYLKSICELKLTKECLQMSERKYYSIRICALHKFVPENDIIIDIIIDILKQFAGSVKQIIFYNATLQDDVFYKILQIMRNLKVLRFEGLLGDYIIDQSKDNAEIVWPDVVPSINEIHFKHVDRFSFQKLCLFNNLTTLNVNGWRKIGTLEHFLLMQKNLKVLHLKTLFMFESDLLTNNIKFSLEELTLNGISWRDNQSAMKFFKTQNNLKKVTLNIESFYKSYPHGEMCFNELITHLLGYNLQLKTAKLSTHGYYGFKITDLNFLEGIVNPSVENLELELDSSQNATTFISALIKLFPNVKNFTYKVINEVDHGLDLIHNWKSLESIDCYTVDINQFFENVNIGEKLTTCTIRRYKDDINKPIIMEFLTRHQNIKHMTLNSYYETIIPDEIISIITNTLKSFKKLICGVECFMIYERFLKFANLL